jgi:hypothetical protein
LKGKVSKFPNPKDKANPIEKILEEDTEKYPSTGKFGFTAWSFHGVNGLQSANKKFESLTAEEIINNEPEAPKADILIPVGEFSTKEFAEQNKIEYPIAFLFIKDSVTKGQIKFVREERRNVKGKPTKLFAKV